MTDGTTEQETKNEEEFEISGSRLLERIRELVDEGNARRIIIKNEEGRSLIEIPLTLGVVGVALIPVWVAVGAIAALAANFRITVVRDEAAVPV